MNFKKIVFIFILVFGVYFGYQKLFISEEDLIVKKLNHLAQLISKEKNENVVKMAGRLKKALDYFSPPVMIEFMGKDELTHTVSAKDQNKIRSYLSAMRLRYPYVDVLFQKLKVDIIEDEAKVTGFARLEFYDSNNKLVYDLYLVEFILMKIENNWKIKGLAAQRESDSNKD